MKTMTKDPYVYHVPVLTGGKGYNEVYTFYSNSFVGKMPSDTKFVRISRTIGKDQIVDELIISFTHDIEIPAMIPRISPTGNETVEDNLNKTLVQEFSKYLISKETSANYQRNCIKIILMFADFLQSRKEEEKTNLSQVTSIDDIIAFLDTRRKTKDEDPEL